MSPFDPTVPEHLITKQSFDNFLPLATLYFLCTERLFNFLVLFQLFMMFPLFIPIPFLHVLISLFLSSLVASLSFKSVSQLHWLV